MKKVFCLLLLFGVFGLLPAQGAHAGDPGTAKGFLDANGEKVPLTHSYAVQEGKKFRVTLSDRPLAGDAVQNYKRLVELGADGEVSAIQVVIGKGKKIEEALFFDRRIPAELSVRSTGRISSRGLKDGVLSGDLVMKDPGFSFGYRVSFSAPVMPAKEREIVEQDPDAPAADRALAEIRSRGLDFDEEAFRRAVQDGDAGLVRLFLDAGMPAVVFGRPAIATAVEFGHAGVVQVLVDAGSDVDCRDEAGQSLVLQAASRGRLEVLQILISAGADVNIPNMYKSTPLSSAADSGNLSMVKALIQAGANVNARTPSGGTALQAAVFKGHEKIVRLLIASGADVARDRKELIEIARRGKHPEIERLLRNPPKRKQ